MALIKVFLIKEKPTCFRLLMFQHAQHMDQMVIFCLCRHELAPLHLIWLVSKVLMHNFSNRMPWNLELLRSAINWLSVIFCIFYANLGVLMVLWPLPDVLYLATVVESLSVASSSLTTNNCTIFRKWAISKSLLYEIKYQTLQFSALQI